VAIQLAFFCVLAMLILAEGLEFVFNNVLSVIDRLDRKIRWVHLKSITLYLKTKE